MLFSTVSISSFFPEFLTSSLPSEFFFQVFLPGTYSSQLPHFYRPFLEILFGNFLLFPTQSSFPSHPRVFLKLLLEFILCIEPLLMDVIVKDERKEFVKQRIKHAPSYMFCFILFIY